MTEGEWGGYLMTLRIDECSSDRLVCRSVKPVVVGWGGSELGRDTGRPFFFFFFFLLL